MGLERYHHWREVAKEQQHHQMHWLTCCWIAVKPLKFLQASMMSMKGGCKSPPTSFPIITSAALPWQRSSFYWNFFLGCNFSQARLGIFPLPILATQLNGVLPLQPRRYSPKQGRAADKESMTSDIYQNGEHFSISIKEQTGSYMTIRGHEWTMILIKTVVNGCNRFNVIRIPSETTLSGDIGGKVGKVPNKPVERLIRKAFRSLQKAI